MLKCLFDLRLRLVRQFLGLSCCAAHANRAREKQHKRCHVCLASPLTTCTVIASRFMSHFLCPLPRWAPPGALFPRRKYTTAGSRFRGTVGFSSARAQDGLSIGFQEDAAISTDQQSVTPI